MPDMLEQLAEETLEELFRTLPAEKAETLIKRLSAEERLKGLSADELLAALSPATRAALAERLKDDVTTPKPEPREPKQGEGK